VPQAKKATKKDDVEPVAPVHLERNNTADDMPYFGGFLVVVGGEYSGRYGVYQSNLQHDEKTGMPTLINVHTRDEHDENIAVAYEDTRRSEAGHR
jgi:hypothetical protein